MDKGQLNNQKKLHVYGERERAVRCQ